MLTPLLSPIVELKEMWQYKIGNVTKKNRGMVKECLVLVTLITKYGST